MRSALLSDHSLLSFAEYSTVLSPEDQKKKSSSPKAETGSVSPPESDVGRSHSDASNKGHSHSERIGPYLNSAENVRSASRYYFTPELRSLNLGLRPARVITE